MRAAATPRYAVLADLAAATDRRLSDWSAQANVHFWEKRRTAALVVARELLAGSDHNTVQVTDATERGNARYATRPLMAGLRV